MLGTAGAFHEVEVRDEIAQLVNALEDWRGRDQITQDDAALGLGISRKTYVLFESGRWFPPQREMHFFAHKLFEWDAEAGDAFVRACGVTRRHFGIAEHAAPVALDAKHARAVYDAAVYASAEATGVAPPQARAIVEAVVAKLQEAGVTMVQARELAQGAR